MDLRKLIFFVLAICALSFIAQSAISDDKTVKVEGKTYNCPPLDVAKENLNTARTERDKAVLKAVTPTKIDQQSQIGTITGRENLDSLVDAVKKDTA